MHALFSFWEALQPRPLPKLTISPAQALLLLIDKYQDDEVLANRLKRWYLNGFTADRTDPQNPQQSIPDAFMHLLEDEALEPYTVSFDMEIINQDASRRYFETHLAYHTLSEHLDDIRLIHLLDYRNYLYRLFKHQIHFKLIPELQAAYSTASPSMRAQYRNKMNHLFMRSASVDDAFRGIDSKFLPHGYKEYANYIGVIEADDGLFKNFPPRKRIKIKTIIQCALLAVVHTKVNDELPIAIYNKGAFLSEHRGKVKRRIPRNMLKSGSMNNHLGILNPHMPVPRFDIATTKSGFFNTVKPSEISSYREEAYWPKYNFAHVMHPFVGAVSGTTLAQLRNLEYINRTDVPHSFADTRESLGQYLRLFISAMLFGAGGHSIFECTSVLSIHQVRDELTGVDTDRRISMDLLFRRENTAAFETALKESIEYNRLLIQKQELNIEIEEVGKQSQLRHPT